MSKQKDYTVSGYVQAYVTLKVKAEDEELAKEVLYTKDASEADIVEFDLLSNMTDVTVKEVEK